MKAAPTMDNSALSWAAMARLDIDSWYSGVIAWLIQFRGVKKPTAHFNEAVCSTLFQHGYSASHALLSEKWLKLGEWDKFRKAGELKISDFIPKREDLSTLSELDTLIDLSARRIVSILARKDYVSRDYMDRIVDEVRIKTRNETELELKKYSSETAMAIMNLIDEKNALQDALKRVNSLNVHAHLARKRCRQLLPHCRQLSTIPLHLDFSKKNSSTVKIFHTKTPL